MAKWVGLYPACLACPGVSSDGATVSPDPSCLRLQYLCCNSSCVWVLGSVCYIWIISPVLSGVLCEFKYALSNSLFLSFFLSLGGPEPLGHASGLPDMITPCCPQSTWTCCCSSFNCSACDYYYYLTMLVIYEHLNILAMFCYNLHPAQPEEDWPPHIAWFLSRFLPRFWPF